MELFHILSQSAQRFPSRIAATDGTSMLTYRQLADYSDRLALYLDGKMQQKREIPCLFTGTKSPFMLVCFLACMKSGNSLLSSGCFSAYTDCKNGTGRYSALSCLRIGTISLSL